MLNGGSNSGNSPIHRKSGQPDHDLPPGHSTDRPSTTTASESVDESKYGKRRYQKHQQRTKQAFVLLAVSLCFLAFTFWQLRKAPLDRKDNISLKAGTGGDDDGSAAGGDDDDGGATARQRQAHKQQRKQKEKQQRQRPDRHRGQRADKQETQSGREKTNHRGLKKNKNKNRRINHQEFPRDDDGQGGGDDGADRDGDDTTPGDDGNFLKRESQLGRRRMRKLEEALDSLEKRIQTNRNHGIRWVDPGLVPPLKEGDRKPMLEMNRVDKSPVAREQHKKFFRVKRSSYVKMAWEMEDMAKAKHTGMRHSFVDYTKHGYRYPEKLLEPPALLGEYPKLTAMKDMMEMWPQDDLDHPPAEIQEDLMHFDYNNPEELEAARKFRDAKLPFKVVNVPEVVAAGEKWTDEYVALNFDGDNGGNGPPADGTCQESPDNFFAFYTPPSWNVEKLGLPPTRTNDWTYAKWAQHARYADKVGLNTTQPHFYWQAGVDRDERHKSKKHWSFISRDLPSFSCPTESFFVFEPDEQKGIQCRFGERGVTAATHYDTGRNMVAMMIGAKRYILSPPRECSKLGIVTNHANPIYRHSMLNFGHLSYINRKDMPQEEREWMRLAGTAGAVSTVLKAGEVLYIPSHWFHYIISLQKSAQCNVRSGVDKEGDSVFGGIADVTRKCNAALSL